MPVSCRNEFEMLSETVDGVPPDGLTLPAAPPLLLPFEFDGVLDLGTEPQ